MAIVYLLRNIENGKLYVGKTKSTLDARWQQHTRDSATGRYAIHRAIQKYGSGSFTRRVLGEFPTEEDALAAEREWIAKLGTMTPHGYNMVEGGRGTLGYRLNAEQKARRSEMAKSYWNDPEFRAKCTASGAATLTSPEVRAKIAEVKASPDWISACSARMKAIHARPDVKEKQKAGIKAAKSTPEGKARTAEGAKKRSAFWASLTHCRRGHEMTPENTHRPPYAPTTRICRACERDNARAKHVPKPKRTHCKRGHELPAVAPGAKYRKCAVCSAEWVAKHYEERKALYRAAREAGLSWADAVKVRDGVLPLPQTG